MPPSRDRSQIAYCSVSSAAGSLSVLVGSVSVEGAGGLVLGWGGLGIFRVREDGLNLGAVVETLTDNGRRTIMAQRYIPEIVDGDKRVLLIDGAVVPFCLARIPQAGEVRGNLAAGGTGVAMPLSAREREIAEGLAPILRARGLMLVGLDIIGAHLTEINVTSPTCFQEIMQQTECNVAAMFVDALERPAA